MPNVEGSNMPLFRLLERLGLGVIKLLKSAAYVDDTQGVAVKAWSVTC